MYQLRDDPSWPREDVMAAWLAVGKERAIVPHESALDLHELSDVISNRIHLTVPRSIRNLPKIPMVMIHTTTRPIRQDEIRTVEGIRVTSPVRTILDAAEWGAAGNQIEAAVEDAVYQGLATPMQLQRAAEDRDIRVQHLIDRSVAVTA